MKRAKRFKIYAVILLIVFSIFISGCWDAHELNKLSIVAGLGWDADPKKGEVTLTYQSIIPSEVKGSASSSQGESQHKGGGSLHTIQLDHDTANFPYQVLNRYTQHSSRIPFYQHAQVMVFGKEAVQQGIYPFLDTIARNPAGRPNLMMVVSEQKASAILAIPDGMENIQAVGMVAEIKLSANFSRYPAVTYLEFANRLMSKTTAPIAPIIGIFEETGPGGEKIKKMHITGTAVFKGDKMVGKLNENQSSGLLWAINKVKKGFVNIPEASLEIVKAKSKIIPELQGNKIIMTIEINEESNLIEFNGHQDLTSDIIKDLEMAQAKEIKNQVRAVVEKSFALNADVFGFGDAVHRKYKKEWLDLKPQWDEIYPGIEVVIKVKTHINEVGDINKALM